MSTNAENLVKISPLVAEIFGGLCQFLLSHSSDPRKLWGYWTDLRQICKACRPSWNITTEYLFNCIGNIAIFWNAGVPNERRYPNERYLFVDDRSGTLFLISEGTLSWQPVSTQNHIHRYNLLHCHSETEWEYCYINVRINSASGASTLNINFMNFMVYSNSTDDRAHLWTFGNDTAKIGVSSQISQNVRDRSSANSQNKSNIYWAQFYGAIAVPSVTRCRCCRRCCCGHRCTGGVQQWRRAVVNGNVKQAACGGSQWRMGPTLFKCFLFWYALRDVGMVTN